LTVCADRPADVSIAKASLNRTESIRGIAQPHADWRHTGDGLPYRKTGKWNFCYPLRTG
jgi:hypothetical protein